MEPSLSLFTCLIFLIHSGVFSESLEKNLPTEWTSWASWTSCTRTCGTGIRLRQRICLDKRSATEMISTKCKGVSKEYDLCNLQRCPPGYLDFRSQQCNKISSDLNFPQNLYKWVQATELSATDPCSLVCQTSDKDPIDVKVISPVVMDSTPCFVSGRTGICVNNECISVGCNNKLHSTLELDKCGICGGDGRRCFEVADRFEKFRLLEGLYSIIKLPVKAGNVRVIKTPDDATNLVVSNSFGGTIFSGLSRSFLPHGEEHQIGGTIIFYSHPNAMTPVVLLIKESQNTSVEILVLVNKDNSHVNISYSFMSPLDKIPTETPLIEFEPIDSYQPLEIEFEFENDVTEIPTLFLNTTGTWRTLGPVYCSSTCSIGIIYPYALCFNNSEVVNDSFCDEHLKPKVDPKLCVRRECSARWVPSNWGPCSVSCGNGTRHRLVHCWKMLAPGLDSTVNKDLCDDHLRPPDVRTCYSEPCASQWLATEWSECKCGVKSRQVRCLKGKCSVIDRPEITQLCNSPTCSWKKGNWTECTEVCGTRTREITCQMSNMTLMGVDACGNETRPLTHEICSRISGFCAPTWIPQTWTKCSAVCGSGSKFGIKIRTAVCMGWKKNRLITFKEKKCRNLTKPELKSPCRIEKCQSQWFFSQWSKCSTSCDAGYRIRQVICYNGNSPASDCSVITRPANNEWCNQGPCPR